MLGAGLSLPERGVQRCGGGLADDLAAAAKPKKFGGGGAEPIARPGESFVGRLQTGGGGLDLCGDRWVLPSAPEITQTNSQPSERPHSGTTSERDARRLTGDEATYFSDRWVLAALVPHRGAASRVSTLTA